MTSQNIFANSLTLFANYTKSKDLKIKSFFVCEFFKHVKL